MRRKTLIFVLAVVVLAGATAGGLYWHWRNSPRYALQQMALALETRNMDRFFNYVDLKAIFNNFLEASSQDQSASENPDEDEWTRMTRGMSKKFTRFLLPKLFDSFADQIRKVIEKYLLNLKHSEVLAVAAAVTVAKIETRGDEALVTLTDPKTKEPLRLQMRRDQKSGLWQIVSVNYQDLKKVCQREFGKS